MMVLICTALRNLVRLLSLILVELRSDPGVDRSLVGRRSEAFSLSPCLLSVSVGLVVFTAGTFGSTRSILGSLCKRRIYLVLLP